MMIETLFDRAQRFIGIKELADGDHPLIQWWFSLCTGFDIKTKDEVAWCSAFINGIAWDLRLPRSKSAGARSWLLVGLPVELELVTPGNVVVILKRGVGNQPGPEVIRAAGHVGLYAGMQGKNILLLGGNQGNAVSIAPFDVKRVLGLRLIQ